METEEVILDSILEIRETAFEPLLLTPENSNRWPRIVNDLNNQLTVVMGFTESVLHQLETGSVRENGPCCQELRHVLHAATELAGIIKSLAQIAVEAPPAAATAIVAAAAIRSTSVPRTILLVEDEDFVRAVCSRDLRAKGFTVLEAAGSSQAREVSVRHEGIIDLLIIDFELDKYKPENTTGPQLAGFLRPQRPEMKVIYISGELEANARYGRGGIGPDAVFVQKPFMANALTKAVDMVLTEVV